MQAQAVSRCGRAAVARDRPVASKIMWSSGKPVCAAMAATALSIYQTTNSVAFMLPLGIGIATSTRVANALGANNPEEARRYARVAVAMVAALGCFSAVVIFSGRHVWPRIFVPPRHSQHVDSDDSTGPSAELSDTFWELESHLLLVLCFYVIGDALAVYGGSVLRGTGRQKAGAKVVLFAYYVVGLPIGYTFCFVLGMGVYGLACGMVLGKMAHVLAILFLVARTDWEAEAENARTRMAASSALELELEEL